MLSEERKANQALGAKYHAELVRRRKLHNELQEVKGNIRVLCRIRPFIKSELKRLPGSAVDSPHFKVQDGFALHIVNDFTMRENSYEYDRVFEMNEGQNTVYEEISPLITSVLDGYNVCIVAYGQTGSGKTYTLEGGRGENEGGIN